MSRVAHRRITATKDSSELLFEAYLNEQGVQHEYEPLIAGRLSRPDYRVEWNEHTLVCEVKGLHARRQPQRVGTLDPYAGIRKEIHEVRRQFRWHKDKCCILVLHNVDDWEFTAWPPILFAAMLGNPAFCFPVDTSTGTGFIDQGYSTFGEGGKMIDGKGKRPQNTTISAVAVLNELSIPNPEFEIEYRKRAGSLESRTDRKAITACIGLRMKLHDELPVTLGYRPRVTVFENPLARIPLPESAFRGPYDARHRYNQNLRRIVRTYAGSRLMDVERLTKGDDTVVPQLFRFVDELVRQFKPAKVILFGSRAYGCPEPDSDVDLMVIFPGDGDVSHRSLEIRKRLNAGFPLDLLARSVGEVEKRYRLQDWFIRDIVDRGKVLHDASNG